MAANEAGSSSFLDIHHHLVFGVDDGPEDFTGSVGMLEAAAEDGIVRVIATSHATPGSAAFPLREYLERVRMLDAYCRERRIPLEISPGAEVLYHDAALCHIESGHIPTLAGSRFVLIEFPICVSSDAMRDAIRVLSNGGYIPVIAHAERYEAVQGSDTFIHHLRETFDTRLQLNCESMFAGPFSTEGRCARRLIKAKLADYVATDAHNVSNRRVTMRACYEALSRRYGAKTAISLTGGNQREIFSMVNVPDI